MSEPIYTKKCRKCKEIKPISDFGNHAQEKDGFRCTCKMCLYKHYEEDKINSELRISGLKKCRTCKEIKPISDFEKAVNGIDGHRNECRDCRSVKKIQYSIKNKEMIREQKRKYAIDNKERTKEYKKEYVNLPALYSTFSHRLTVEEAPRLSDDGLSLECICKYCGCYHIPSNISVIHRISSIVGKFTGDCNLYCSEGCKQSCSTYNRRKYPKGFKPDTSREVQPELRKLVLARDNYTCQKCYKSKEESPLHCHHYEGIELNPIESADIDNCVTLCKKCHNTIHTDCDMRRDVCPE